MNNFIFYSPTEFVFGRDTEAQTGVLVQKYGARKIMIVYGGGSVIRSGLLARVEKSLQETGIPYCIDRKSTRLNSSHANESRMPSSA